MFWAFPHIACAVGLYFIGCPVHSVPAQPHKTKPCSQELQTRKTRKSSPQGVTIPNANSSTGKPSHHFCFSTKKLIFQTSYRCIGIFVFPINLLQESSTPLLKHEYCGFRFILTRMTSPFHLILASSIFIG